MRANERRTVVRKFVCILLIVIIAIALFIAMMFTCSFGISATADFQEQPKQAEELLAQIIDPQEHENLLNPSFYDATLSEYNFSEQSVITLHFGLPWWSAHGEIEEMIAEAKRYFHCPNQYVILGEKPLKISQYINDDGLPVFSLETIYDTTPMWISDIESAVMYDEQAGTLQNIVCFDGSNRHDGMLVYYVYDNYFVANYYEYEGKCLVLKEDEFKQYVKEYNDLVTSYEYNFDENGNRLFGKPSFNDFYRNYGKSHTEQPQELSDSAINQSLPMPLENQPSHDKKILIYACGIVSVFAFGGITVLIVLKKKKLRN